MGCEEDGRRPLRFLLVGGRCGAVGLVDLVVDKRTQYRGLRFDVGPVQLRGGGDEYGVALGENKINHGAFQVVPLPVGRERDVPVERLVRHESLGAHYGQALREAEVNLLLNEGVVDVHECRVGVEVTHHVIAVLGVALHIVGFEDAFGEVALYKSVAVPLPLRVLPYVVDDSPRDAFLAVVVIALYVPFALGQVAEETRFAAPGLHITVLAHGCSVPGCGAVG